VTGLCFRPAAELWPLVDRAFQRHSREIRVLVPSATVEHVGATAVPGLLTKGDLDLLVRVPPGEVDAAIEALQLRYPGLVDDSAHPSRTKTIADVSPDPDQRRSTRPLGEEQVPRLRDMLQRAAKAPRH